MLTSVQNPPVQAPAEVPLDALEGRWWVAHVKPRQEKALAWDVARWGGAYFLPLYEKKHRRRGRSWKAVLPLFPGYVFLCGDEAQRSRALETRRIANVIPVLDQEGLVRELSGIQRMLAAGLAVDPFPGLQRGRRCRVRSGALADLEGCIERRAGRTRFVVNVDILGQAAAVEIDADLLEPIT